MKKNGFVLFLIPFTVFSLSECDSEPEKKSQKIILNPNGMSEMSLLMEKMSADLFQLKDSILNHGSFPKELSSKQYSTLTSAKTTKKNVINEEFLAFSASFLTSFDILMTSIENDRIKEFNRAVTTCKNCHQDICPGPVARINKLYIR